MRGKMKILFCLLVLFISCMAHIEAQTISGYCYDSISEVGNYSDTLYLSNLHLSQNYLYLFTPDKGMLQMDITNQTKPVLTVVDSTFKTVESMVNSGDYLYVAAGSAGLQILNDSMAGAIQKLSIITTGGWASDVAVSGKYAYLANGPDGLRIYDISNPSSPIEKSHLELEGYASRIKLHDNYAYIAEADNGLGIIDISDPAQPVLVSQYTAVSPVLDISFSLNSCLVLAAGAKGIAICSLSGDTGISVLNKQPLSGYARRILWSGAYIYVSDFEGGLQVLETRTPGSESVAVDAPGHHRAMACEVNNNYIYLASGFNGLNILTKPSPLENVRIILSGNSNQTTYTNANGYYCFEGIQSGLYTVEPYRDPDYFYPMYQSFEYLDVSQDKTGVNFKRSLWKWSGESGVFSDSLQTTNWSFEVASGCSSRPEISWEPFVNGKDGVLAIHFTQANQGIKITAKPRVDFMNPIFRLGSLHYRISSDTHLLLDSFKYSLMGFSGWTSYDYREILTNKYDEKTASGAAWMDFWLPFRINSETGIVQLELRNTNSTGIVYLDTVDINQDMVYQDSNYKTLPGGDFSASTDMNYWTIESYSEATAGLPEISWVAQMDDHSGALRLKFSQAGKGALLVLKNPYVISTTSAEETRGGFMFDMQVKGTDAAKMKIHAIHYGEAAGIGPGYSNDTGEYFNLGNSTPGKWQTYYIPLVSSGALKRHYEMEVLYSGNETVDLYLDNVRWVPAKLAIE